MTFDFEKESRTKQNVMTPLTLFSEKKVVKICAPMVRYSKLAFRQLVRKYDCDLAFTPMILSNSFVKSVKARDSEFTTNKDDHPLIVQFAANNAADFADAAEIIAPYSNGIDLNCGCPQRWAYQEGIGVCLINKPQLVADIVSQAKARVNDSNFTVSIKIRIHKDIRTTIDLCQKMEKAGVSFLSVHGRTPEQRCEPVNLDAIRLIKENVSMPVVANGDIKSLQDVNLVHEKTGVNGVMAARGLLKNPAMYAGYELTPLQCVKDWLDISLSLGTPYNIFHHHLIEMLDSNLPKSEKRLFNGFDSTSAVLGFLKENYGI